MADLSRRGLFGLFGAGAAVAALPAIPASWAVPETVAPSVATVAAASIGKGNALLTVDMITREAVRLFKSQNVFLANMNEYDRIFD